MVRTIIAILFSVQYAVRVSDDTETALPKENKPLPEHLAEQATDEQQLSRTERHGVKKKSRRETTTVPAIQRAKD